MSSIPGDHESLGNIHLPAKNVSNMLGKQHRILLFPGMKGCFSANPIPLLLSRIFESGIQIPQKKQ